MVVKGVASAVIVFFTTLQNQYGTILWVVLAMVIMDVLLNVGNEQKQFNKLGSAFVAIGAPTIVSNNMGNPEMTHVVLALVAISYVQVLYPQLITMLGKFGQSKAVVSAEMAAIQDLQKQILTLAEASLPAASVLAQSSTSPVDKVPATTNTTGV